MEWQNNVQNKPKLRLYRDIKLEFIPEPYVVKYVPKHARSLLAQIRLGILPTGEEVSIDKQVACEECPRWLKMTEVACEKTEVAVC